MEELTLLCYDKCGTCRKAGQWLRAHGLDYTARSIREQNPSEAELDEWITASGLPVGGDLEYADEVTLQRAMEGRQEL